MKKIFIIKKSGYFIRKTCYIKGGEVYTLTIEFCNTFAEALHLE